MPPRLDPQRWAGASGHSGPAKISCGTQATGRHAKVRSSGSPSREGASAGIINVETHRVPKAMPAISHDIVARANHELTRGVFARPRLAHDSAGTQFPAARYVPRNMLTAMIIAFFNHSPQPCTWAG